MSPVRGYLAERHETLFARYRAQTGVWAETGECLSKASFERRREVADTIVAGGTVEAVAGGGLSSSPGSSGSLKRSGSGVRATRHRPSAGARRSSVPWVALSPRRGKPLPPRARRGSLLRGCSAPATGHRAEGSGRGTTRGPCAVTPPPAAAGKSGRRSVSAARTLLGERARRPPSAQRSSGRHSGDVRDELLSEHLLKVCDDVGDARLDGLAVGLLWG